VKVQKFSVPAYCAVEDYQLALIAEKERVRVRRDEAQQHIVLSHASVLENLKINHDHSVSYRLETDPEFRARYEAACVVFEANAVKTDEVVRKIAGIFAQNTRRSLVAS
jgi:hypothetical protein